MGGYRGNRSGHELMFTDGNVGFNRPVSPLPYQTLTQAPTSVQSPSLKSLGPLGPLLSKIQTGRLATSSARKEHSGGLGLHRSPRRLPQSTQKETSGRGAPLTWRFGSPEKSGSHCSRYTGQLYDPGITVSLSELRFPSIKCRWQTPSHSTCPQSGSSA